MPIRGSVHDLPKGDITLIQPKDLGENYRILFDEAQMFSGDSLAKNYQTFSLRPSDVLMTTRGENLKVGIMPNSTEFCVPSSSLFRMRIENKQILEHRFFARYLNSKPMKEKISQSQSGSHIPNLKRSVFEKLTIPVPSLERQTQIVELAELIDKQQKLNNELHRNQMIILDELFKS